MLDATTTHVLKDVLHSAHLTAIGPVRTPDEGRIAINAIVPTQEEGTVLVRVRPKNINDQTMKILGYKPERFVYEPIAINHYKDQGIPVPELLPLKNETTFLFDTPECYAYVYRLTEGKTVEQADLSLSLVTQIAELLSRFINASEKFTDDGKMPDGDIDYIVQILRSYLDIDSSKESLEVIDSMVSYLGDESQRDKFEATPSGLVHGDLFYENIILSDRGEISIIDFGDIYYGKVLMDITTSAMEFSCVHDALDEDLFVAMIAPTASWFAIHNVGFETFHYALLANCARFAAHTLHLEHVPGQTQNPSENDYVQRFHQFQKGEKNSLERLFSLACQKD